MPCWPDMRWSPPHGIRGPPAPRAWRGEGPAGGCLLSYEDAGRPSSPAAEEAAGPAAAELPDLVDIEARRASRLIEDEEAKAAEPSYDPSDWLEWALLGLPAAAAAAAPPSQADAPRGAFGMVRRHDVPLGEEKLALKATLMDALAPPLAACETVYERFAELFRQLSPSDGGFNTAVKVALMYALVHLSGVQFEGAMRAPSASARRSTRTPTGMASCRHTSARRQLRRRGAYGALAAVIYFDFVVMVGAAAATWSSLAPQ